MTDEEMAEEYADNISGLELTCSLLSAKNKNYAYRLGRYEGFLAGLKAGRPEWHKVADGDLPKEEDLEMQVLCFTYDGYRLLSLFSDPKPIFKGYGVIAWCEIPKYTEE